MSWAFITAMKKNPQQSYVQLLNSIRDELATKYTQKPQLSCSHPLGQSAHSIPITHSQPLPVTNKPSRHQPTFRNVNNHHLGVRRKCKGKKSTPRKEISYGGRLYLEGGRLSDSFFIIFGFIGWRVYFFILHENKKFGGWMGWDLWCWLPDYLISRG